MPWIIKSGALRGYDKENVMLYMVRMGGDGYVVVVVSWICNGQS